MNFKRYHVSKNLFDYSTVTTGYRIQWITGADYADATAVRSDYIPVNSGTYSCSDSVIVLGYDANKDYLGATNGDGVFEKIAKNPISQFTVPTNSLCKYIKILAFNSSVSTNIDAETMLNTGSTPQPYEPYSSEVWHDTPHYIHNTSTDTITTPADIYANDTTATVGLKGNMEQTGTPSPQNPVMPNGTGDKTANLLDYTTVESTTNAIATQISGGISVSGRYYVQFSKVKFIVGNTYTMSWKANTTSGISAPAWRFHYADNTYSSMPSSRGTLIAEKEVAELLLYVSTTESCVVEFTEIMLNSGSAALPYKPFGYEIPISSASTTTPVYLGEVESTRRIKKLVLDGTENRWNKSGAYQGSFYLAGGAADAVSLSYQAYCSHATFTTLDQYTRNTFCFNGSPINLNLWIGESSWTTDDFKAYLQQQYAAGTPVTVWYVLATEETGIVNEPLMKIGNYADEVSGISIPTIAGANTISVGTTLQPSEVSVNYKGWHPVQSAHEAENGQWT